MYQDNEKKRVGGQRAEDVIAKMEKRKKRIKKLIRCVAYVLLVSIVFHVAVLPIAKRVIFISKYGKEVYDILGLVEKGAYITFGHYEQDNNLENGQEEIEWLVLKVEEGRALVISKYALDCQPYHTDHRKVTWDNCSLRTWLNREFLQTAFTPLEAAMIPRVTEKIEVEEEGVLMEYDKSLGRVFLWSIEDEDDYPSFRREDKKQCQATAYARDQGARSRGGVVSWWLRDIDPGITGEQENRVKCITYAGKEGSCGQGDHGIAVRPVLWIDLKFLQSNIH